MRPLPGFSDDNDAVLLSGTANNIVRLCDRLGRFAAYQESDLPLHNLAHVVAPPSYPLFMSRLAKRADSGF